MKAVLAFLVLVSSIISAQEHKIIKDSKNNKSMLIGISDRAAFQDTNFAWWFNSEYMNYDVDTNTIKIKREKFSDKKVKIVLGTWCSDSRREVPRVLKILDYINFPQDSLIIINVDRNKEGLSDEGDGLDIEYVPTIIVYDDDEEIGRIIETPKTTLEIDLLEIVE